jgi:hypothetical protein
MDKIYLVTVMNEKGDRCWGWLPTFEEAEDTVLENVGDIFECYYDYAVIEECLPGWYHSHKQMGWYKAIFDTSKKPYPQVIKIERPKEYDGVFNFGVG